MGTEEERLYILKLKNRNQILREQSKSLRAKIHKLEQKIDTANVYNSNLQKELDATEINTAKLTLRIKRLTEQANSDVRNNILQERLDILESFHSTLEIKYDILQKSLQIAYDDVIKLKEHIKELEQNKA